MVWHIISSAFSDPAGTVGGQLLRWVDNQGDVGFEVRIDGLEDSGGTSDVAAFSAEMLWALAGVANDLRYEWEIVLGLYRDREWTYFFTSRYPNARYPDEEAAEIGGDR